MNERGSPHRLAIFLGPRLHLGLELPVHQARRRRLRDVHALVAGRLVIGAALLWTVVLIARQPLPREPQIYGHLLVMGVINITIPFLLITWAEQSVESSLAAILTSPVPLFAIVLSALFLPDEPMRVNGLVGLIVGFIGVVIITSRG